MQDADHPGRGRRAAGLCLRRWFGPAEATADASFADRVRSGEGSVFRSCDFRYAEAYGNTKTRRGRCSSRQARDQAGLDSKRRCGSAPTDATAVTTNESPADIDADPGGGDTDRPAAEDAYTYADARRIVIVRAEQWQCCAD